MKLLAESEPVMAAAPMGSDTAGMPWLPPFGPALMLLAGFRDCAEEALRFLAEVEGVSQSDPLYTGLQHFLLEKERSLALPMSEAECSIPDLQTPDSHLSQPCFSFLPAAVLSPGMNFGIASEPREVISEGKPPVEPLSLSPEDCPVQTVVEEDCGVEESLLPPVSQCEDSTVRNLVNELLVLLQEESMATDEMDDDYVDEEDCSYDMSNSMEETVDQ